MFSRQFPKSYLSVFFCFLLISCAISTDVWAGPYSNGMSDGVAYNDPDILAWATGSTGQRVPYAGYPSFGDYSDATGPAPGTLNDVVSLGIGGSATLTFDVTIANGPGPDLAVFENAQSIGSNVFAELAFVEVSSNGSDFVRFPSRSLTSDPVGPFGSIDPTDVHNLAGKHVNNMTAWLGTPFDLADLTADPKVLSGDVDLLDIHYVRIIDVIGDGLALDSQGDPIYDPYLTNFLFSDPELGLLETGGFDLDAVAVLNTAELSGDVDGNGYVDGVDTTIILSNWGLQDATRDMGDLNGNGTVEGSDYSEVLVYWGTGELPASAPEPGTLLVLFFGGAVALQRRDPERK